MSQQKIKHSLPLKTQPTFYTNYKHPRSAEYILKNKSRNYEDCPEICQFNISSFKNMPYIHHLDIDFGKIQRPNHFYFEGNSYQKVIKMSDGQVDGSLSRQEISTKRFKGISNITQQTVMQQKNTQKKKIVRIQDLNPTQQSRPVFYSKDNKKRKIKLQEVRAYEQKTLKGSNVKKIHSRVVKMMVGGGKVTTKVINYPDNNEYLKLCGLK